MNTCHGKNIYDSEKQAKRVRISVGKSRTIKLRIYKCKECHGYHLTKTEPFV